MKNTLILFGLCASLILFACDVKTPQPVLGLSYSGSVPTNYNCNSESRFQVSFRSYNDKSLTGDYLKMFFCLERDSVIFYQSNDINFPINRDSNQTQVYTLEFGGAIEDTYYNLIGYLKLMDNNMVVKSTWTQARYISITPKTGFTKTMHIEYDCQNTYGFSLQTFEKIASAFHIADTDTDFLYDELVMPPVDLPADDLGIYSVNHWSDTQGYKMHLLAVGHLEDNDIDSTLGQSTMGGAFGFTFVFIQDIFDFYPD